MQRACEGRSGAAKPVPACPNLFRRHRRSWTLATRRTSSCYSALTPEDQHRRRFLSGLQRQCSAAHVSFSFPMMLSAIDPVQEAKLVGLPQTIVRGKYLPETLGLLPPVERVMRIAGHRVVPYFPRRTLTASVQHLTIPRWSEHGGENSPTPTSPRQTFPQGLGGPVVEDQTLSAQSSYDHAARSAGQPPRLRRFPLSGSRGNVVRNYWTTSGVHYKTRRPSAPTCDDIESATRSGSLGSANQR